MAELERGERLQIMLAEDELRALDDWRFEKRMPSRASAARTSATRTRGRGRNHVRRNPFPGFWRLDSDKVKKDRPDRQLIARAPAGPLE